MFVWWETCRSFPSTLAFEGPPHFVSTASKHELRYTYPNAEADTSQPDIIDETLDLFRANSLFRNFEIKGPADRLLIVLILFISDCLAKISAARTPPTQIECTKLLNTLAVDSFAIPGDAGFPLNAHYQSPASRLDGGK
jgi:actin related protein 2/3 complex subunit 3